MSNDHLETRGITAIPGTGRTTLQLEPEAWRLIDAVAAGRGQNWREWVEDQLRHQPDDSGMSRAAWVRCRAMGLFYETAAREQLQEIAQGRADVIALGDPFSNPDLDGVLGFLDEERFAEHLTECPVEGSADLGGFVLHIGFDEFNRRCFWIENQMKGCPSVVISLPEQEAR